MNEIDIIKSKLSDKMRRLTSGKLYKIKDKSGNIVPFIPNKFQIEYLNNKHTLNIIVKARQLGFSTMIDIDYFDDFLFRRGFTVGIIADTEDIAREIFRDKILVAWNNLPDWLKAYYKINTERSNEISIENTGSRISVGTSYRGGTLQRLHISEFGKICNKFPLKAEEIVTGALQTVAIGQSITIESTAMGAEGYFYEFSKRAKDLQDKGQTPSEMEWKLFFYPWRREDKYSIDANIQIQQDVLDYLNELEQKKGIKLKQEQKNWYYMKWKDLTEKMFQEYPTDFDEAFNLSIKGSYYERELTLARLQKRIGNINYDPNLLVHTAWDLGGAGGGDDTAIWFFQTYGNEIRIIDAWAGNQRSLLEIIETIVKAKPYKYGTFYGPHDMNVKEYSSGQSRRDTANTVGIRFEVLPIMPISEGINFVRQTFPKMFFDEQKCGEGLTWLGKYRRAWDEKNGVFMDRPQHNGSSHYADALRYLATAYHNLVTVQETDIIDIDFNY